MEQWMDTFGVETPGRALVEVTQQIARRLTGARVGDGLLTVFIRHTSASLLIQENADPDVRLDLLDALDRLAPEDAPYVHAEEGPDDMPAHVKTALTGVSLAIPVLGGRMALGTWQGIYVAEHRARGHRRDLVLHFAGTMRGA
ncbi:secondary thiamine-phosphate synthase enzyme YjbQ [Aurantimonas sp. Leaf443]|uniref:secondary thiamine-phosphate synthase enzyme YjbQ n=1 Tax=Aurantimonas sp. Leaf443 TaxID=1736378 RepID=UPI0006FB7443|nr:secondary thiamine-phosphate synthase enzyme YjbQ [Aurantimonas sp. Leaf443]KQT85773.1 secondary thiamine-phosphate synthase enzyme [Aurantimonas sp. Leaf443]